MKKRRLNVCLEILRISGMSENFVFDTCIKYWNYQIPLKYNMRLINIKPLGIKAERITGILGMARGLMFSKKRNLLFEFNREQKVGIHMLFVFFPIIAVWIVDEKPPGFSHAGKRSLSQHKNKRIKKVKVMKPFVSFHEEKAKYVLEMPYDKKLFVRMRKSRGLKF